MEEMKRKIKAMFGGNYYEKSQVYKLKESDIDVLIETVVRGSDKKLLDLRNWVKSDISQEENPKLGKTWTHYRGDKMKFLYKLKKMLNS